MELPSDRARIKVQHSIPRLCSLEVPDGSPRGCPASHHFCLGGDATLSDEALVCSARACQSAAEWRLLWNNPKIHTPDRRKIWLACDQHRQSLSDFLGARGFLRDTEPAS